MLNFRLNNLLYSSVIDSTVRRPADAEKFRLEKIAEANKNR